MGAKMAGFTQKIHAVGVCDTPDAFYTQVKHIYLNVCIGTLGSVPCACVCPLCIRNRL